MKVLFSATPAYGHILPLVPLARALRDAGHTAGFLTAAGLSPAIDSEGFDFLPAGPMPEVLFADVFERTGANPAANPTPESITDFFVRSRLQHGAGEALAAGRTWAPDVIISELDDFIGPLVAAELGIPLGSLTFGPAVPPEFYDPMVEAAHAHYRELGATPVAPSWLFDTCPPSLQVDGWIAPGNRWALRPEAHRGARPASPAIPAKRRVLVTFGTVFTEPEVLNPVLAELSTVDAELLVTLGFAAKTEDFPGAGANVAFSPFAPLSELLTGVDAVVTHGGAGTTLGALAHGIPLVVVPQGADQFVQADRVSAAGAGISFGPGTATPETIAEAVRTVLADDAIRGSAKRIADDIAALPSPAEVAARLVESVSTKG
ncbi:glycosyltransferase [Amycolatopsis jejuensis]|uniref:glycosyltransferase n=1 Tax=Amycolatopsis jejuensis TaxID=330084 RepID=UPI000523FBF1|nr:glycosyltransferase [Amycolatopsis jejuensis]